MTELSSEEMLKRLIGFDSTSHKSNLDLIHFVQEYLEGFNISSHLIFDEGRNKANLFATIGPEDKPGIVLSGHTDVVPVEGQDWESDPFELTERNDLLHGRGTCDMKGFIAVALSKLPKFINQDLKNPIHLAFSYDEEVGCLGAHDIAKHIKNIPVQPKLCIVGEPTSMKAITGHKGVCDFECTVHGHECHSSLSPYGVNAVESAAEVVAYIRSVAKRMANEGPFNQEFNPPFTTVHTGTMNGGTAVNIVPNKCDFHFEIRSIPEQDPKELADEIKQYAWKQIEPAMKEIDPKTGFEFQAIADVPGFDISNDDEMVKFVQALSGSNSTEKVSFGTEAGIYQSLDVPTVVCGPGSIEQAHRPNEFVAKEQIIQCERFMERLLEQVL